MTHERKSRGRGRPRARPRGQGRLDRWISAQGLSRAEVAERLGVTRGYVDHLARETRRPSLDLAAAIEEMTSGEVPASYWASVPQG